MMHFSLRLLYGVFFLIGFLYYKLTGITYSKSYISMRRLFYLTGGKFNDNFYQLLSDKRSNVKPEKGLLTDINWQNSLDKLKSNGYVVFDAVLSVDQINEIKSFAKKTPLKPIPNRSESERVEFSAIGQIDAPRFNVEEADIFKCEELINIIFDETLLKFAGDYLDCLPIQDLTAMWWSVPKQSKGGQDKAAQQYHFDMDRLKFVKFFFYLTDVDSETGPHCYIKGTHIDLPKEFSRDGRFMDSELENYYGKDRFIEIDGKSGSIIAVDTRGFHKGKPLLKDSRLIFQVEFANNLFGAPYNEIEIIDHLNEDQREIFLRNRSSFRRFS